MGTEYQLLKIDRGEYFEMGKGFDLLFPLTLKPFILESMFATPTDLAQKLQVAMLDRGWGGTTDEVFKYSHELAGKLFDWAHYDRLVFVNDNSMNEIDFYYEHDFVKYKPFWECRSRPVWQPDARPKETGNRYSG